MSIFDVDDKKAISPINLIEDGWCYTKGHTGVSNYGYRFDYFDWSKTVKLDLGDGYYCYCEFFFNSETKKIHSSDTYRTSTISNMDAINRFIDKQLKRRIEKFEADHHE